MKIKNKLNFRLANVSPRDVSFENFNHCFSAAILETDDKTAILRIDSLLDPKDHHLYQKIYTINIGQFNRIQKYLVKV